MENRAKEILLVDNFRPKRKALKMFLEKSGFNKVHEADDGEDAYSMLKNHKDYVVVSSSNMPKMDGMTLLKKIRDDKTLEEVPVLMMISENEEEQMLDAIFELPQPYKEGVNSYIFKPFKAENLKDKLTEILDTTGYN
jgi:two-component system chemotaxis response regulator CheY